MIEELFDDNYQISNPWKGQKVVRYYGSLNNCHKWLNRHKTSHELINCCVIEEYNYSDWHGGALVAAGQTHGEIV